MEHEEAKRQDLIRLLQDAEVADFSCHGQVNCEDPNKSGLLMANDEMLTVEDLFQLNLKGARMATLSACETGIIGFGLPDEVVALPSALMRAGFAGAVASLWTVSDASTARLMKSFYQLWQKEGLPPAKALERGYRCSCAKSKFMNIPFTGRPST